VDEARQGAGLPAERGAPRHREAARRRWSNVATRHRVRLGKKQVNIRKLLSKMAREKEVIRKSDGKFAV
jgi:hypothetical protein